MAVVGIDLGTTNTVVATVKSGHASPIADADGSVLVPSVVSFHPSGNVLVGNAARERRTIDPRNTVYSIKRLIGRSWNSSEVARARERFPFDMREGPGQAALVVARGETFTLPEISAFVLRHVKSVAEESLAEAVDRAVVTVPANFNDLQRAATKVAGRVAGLEVLRILNEPTAAALAYGYGKNSKERIAIYDFGGGTFDVTILDLSGNVFEVLATAGDTFLGGDDIDLAIVNRLADICLSEHRFDPRTHRESFERLREAAERAKITLGSHREHHVQIPDLHHAKGGKSLSLTARLTPQDLDALARPIVDRTFDVCQEALSIARLSPGDLDQVVLVGGSTRLSLVRARVEAFFDRAPLDHVNPDEVVGIGAAIQASALSSTERRRSTIPKPPMPAARATQSAADAPKRANPPPLPRGKTHPGRSTSNAAGPPGPPGGARKRVTTGLGLGPGAPAPRSRPIGDPARVPAARAGTAHALRRPAARSAQGFSATQRGVAPPPDVATRLDVATQRGVAPPPDAPGARGSHAANRSRPSPNPSNDPLLVAGPGGGPEARRQDPFEATLSSSEGEPSPEPIHAALPPARPASPQPLGAAYTTAEPTPYTMAAPDPAPTQPALPLLVDVTPLGLCVETVGGYCDTLIERNTPVPCAERRTFVTAVDNQTTVRVRVGQGESARFEENTELGTLELSDLAPAARGATRINVSFSLDTDGLLEVRAEDAATGKRALARLDLLAVPGAEDVDAMAARHAERSR